MKSKIRQMTGQRIGQLIYNAIKGCLDIESDDITVASKLFYIEDDELIELVQDYIKGLKNEK